MAMLDAYIGKRASNGLKKSCMEPGLRFFDLVASLRLRVWMPSFFIVIGRST